MWLRVFMPLRGILGWTLLLLAALAGGDVAAESPGDARPVDVALDHDEDHRSALYVPTGQPKATQDDFVGWAKEYAVPLEADDGGTFGPPSLDGLKAAIGNARVVAFGEATHGAHEPLAFRNRLLTFLVEELGFTAIALESGLSESRRLYDYALGGSGDVEQVVRDGFTWGFGDYAENVELLRWVRRYNDDPAHQRKVRVYGIDLSGGVASELPNARIAIDEALAFLSVAAPDASSAVRNGLKPWLGHFQREDYSRLTADERGRMGEAIDGLISFLESRRVELTKATSPLDFDWARRNATVARQLEQMFRLWPAQTPAGNVSPEMQKVMTARDSAMAANVLWALEREGAQGRLLVFAHNAHVMTAPLKGGMWDVFRSPVRMMGHHLRNALGKALMIVGTSSDSIGSGFPVDAGPAGTLDRALGRVGLDSYLIDFRDAQPDTPSHRWLQQTQTLRTNLTTELRIVPREAFDAVVYLAGLSPANTGTERQ